MGNNDFQIYMAWGKKTRLTFRTPQLPKEKGGMNLTHLNNYFYSAQIKHMINLCNKNYYARWKHIELALSSDLPLRAILGLEQIPSKVKNPWIQS